MFKRRKKIWHYSVYVNGKMAYIFQYGEGAIGGRDEDYALRHAKIRAEKCGGKIRKGYTFA